VYKSGLLNDQFEIVMKKAMINVSLKLPLVLVALIAVVISGTNSLLFHYAAGIDGSLSQIAFGASSSNSIFGDDPASTDTDDSNFDTSNSDNTKQGDSDNNKDSDDKTSKPVDEDQTEEEAATATSSGSNIAPQAQGGSSGTEDDTSSSANTSSSSPIATKNVSITGDQQDKSFDPNPIEINAGESVTWTNDDNEIHDVTSGNPEGENMGQEFASSILSSGKSFSHTFDKPGTYEYLCSFHESMTGEVIVK
jgi:plastocyanin